MTAESDSSEPYPQDHVFRTQVVGAAVLDDAEHPTKFLAAQRAYPETLRGMWEFPGGKADPDDASCEAALIRECSEELDVDLQVHHEIPGPHAQGWPLKSSSAMRVWTATVVDGDLMLGPQYDGADHLELRWIPLDDHGAAARELEWIPADRPIVEALLAQLS
ncbi:(deoxy)nucleoside triphosphate pyrophosphohydrolase [Kocuria sp.]|uniref:(deoxy)nucleoside triphosphate pyrophosphohydrolase n=1 Tax=Kocuria sp. TaxID=1871328 RepID=UPI0026E0F891|nr:NUDIX domain-containing protein [Kocuria sp.]MDO5618713.1 NUDIX domain-containing protein [Kocuria sp.]